MNPALGPEPNPCPADGALQLNAVPTLAYRGSLPSPRLFWA